MVKSLKKVLGKLESIIIGPSDVSLKGITQDSKKVKKGFLFVAVRGQKFDGHDFIDEAINRGAKVVVAEKEPERNWLKSISYIKVDNSRKALGEIASNWFGNPSKKLKLIGVTGTDGKTTTASLIYHILKTAGFKVGLISTVSAMIGGKEYETGLHVTSPDPTSLQKLLAEMVKVNCKYAVLEVTSHALDQERVSGVIFDVGVLTNITHEHLDYHKTWLKYRDTKAKLFRKVKVAVLNKDDVLLFEDIRCEAPSDAEVMSYGIKEKSSDYFGANIKIKDSGTEFDIIAEDKSFSIKTKLFGDYNVSNILAACSVARGFDIPWIRIIKAVSTFSAPSGRLEEIKNRLGFKIFIDFAHTPNSLQEVLSLLRKLKKGRLIAVFGCAGERDAEKRSMMGEISGKLSDISVFTAEDPRSESIEKIIEQMANGAIKAEAKEITLGEIEKLNNAKTEKHLFIRIHERGEAITLALHKLAKKGDIIVIAGKGHERSMAYDGTEHPWSDYVAVNNALSAKKDSAAIVLAAGLGSRMKSRTPKVIRKIAGRPMLAYTLQNLRAAKMGQIVIVVGYRADLVTKEIGGSVTFAAQKNPKGGTAQATLVGLKKVLGDVDDVLVLYGDDSAFYKTETIEKVIDSHRKTGATVSFVTLIRQDPTGLGRIVRDGNGSLLGIVEEKDATETQRKIKEINDGLYVFNRSWLEKYLTNVRKSAVSGEYYLVDLIEIALKRKEKVNVFKLKNDREWFGISNQEQLNEAEKIMEERLKIALEG